MESYLAARGAPDRCVSCVAVALGGRHEPGAAGEGNDSRMEVRCGRRGAMSSNASGWCVESTQPPSQTSSSRASTPRCPTSSGSAAWPAVASDAIMHPVVVSAQRQTAKPGEAPLVFPEYTSV